MSHDKVLTATGSDIANGFPAQPAAGGESRSPGGTAHPEEKAPGRFRVSQGFNPRVIDVSPHLGIRVSFNVVPHYPENRRHEGSHDIGAVPELAQTRGEGRAAMKDLIAQHVQTHEDLGENAVGVALIHGLKHLSVWLN